MVIDLTRQAATLREQGRVASYAGDKSAANVMYRRADRFERFALKDCIQKALALTVAVDDGGHAA